MKLSAEVDSQEAMLGGEFLTLVSDLLVEVYVLAELMCGAFEFCTKHVLGSYFAEYRIACLICILGWRQ